MDLQTTKPAMPEVPSAAEAALDIANDGACWSFEFAAQRT
jgi:hypothetical protein